MTGYGEQPMVDPAFVVAHLECAGKTLLALPHSGFSTLLKTSSLNSEMAAVSACGWFSGSAAKCPRPTSRAIDAMDNTMMWLWYIPQDMTVLRRCVGARSLVNPITDKHIYSWRRLGDFMGVDHKTAKRWHADGVRYIVNALNCQQVTA